MRTYYKADICYMTGRFVDNDKEKGVDPDTLQDCGICETIEKPTLEALKEHLMGAPNYYGFEHFEGNRYDGGYEETERDGTHVSVSLSAYIYKVVESEVEL